MENRQEQRVTIKTFEDPVVPGRGIEVSGFANKPLTWSLNFFSTLPDKRVGRFLRPGVRVVNALAVADMAGMRFARLIDEAILFIREESQRDSDEYIARKQYREIRDTERQTRGPKEHKPSPLGGNLTDEQKAAKKLRHEHNLTARRAADAELRSKMRGK
jgi:hypothetical protein